MVPASKQRRLWIWSLGQATTARMRRHPIGVAVVCTTLLTASAFGPLLQISPRCRCRLARIVRSTAEDEVSSKTTMSADERSSGKPRPILPDYGQTPVEIDKIQLAAAKWRRRDLFGNSLVGQTVRDMNAAAMDKSKGDSTINLASLSKVDRLARRRTLHELDIPDFMVHVQEQMDVNIWPGVVVASCSTTTTTGDAAAKGAVLCRRAPVVLQINVGLYCNQACGHCHVESSPLRTEMMTAETAARCLQLLVSTPSITTLDVTGGAPELNACFRTLIAMARHLRPDLTIIDRCNLTVLQEPGQEDLVDFLKENRVDIVASLPCYSQKNVDQSRGNGVFERSIAALLALNDAGYGPPSAQSSSSDAGGAQPNRLKLDLVYNPSGAFLPPPQDKLQVQYKEQLATNFGIIFDQLFTMTNMPVKRFVDFLNRRDELVEYMDLLVRNFNPETVTSLMCRDTVSVGFDGRLYDCDFNQQLGIGLGGKANGLEDGLTIFDVDSLDQLQDHAIRTGRHCFGCTAGMGSS
jgi:radical SAM/Cys-rich protein